MCLCGGDWSLPSVVFFLVWKEHRARSRKGGMNPSSDPYSEVILVRAQDNNPNPVHLQGSKWDQMGYCV